ncbi:MAG: hypothetical protein ACFFE4_09205 [Candidatus Thorarchaeota archaeon]
MSLPKKWVENFNLTSKSPVALDLLNDGSLNISPKHQLEDINLEERLTLHSSPYIAREIVKNSLSGQTNIVVISDKEIDKSIRSEIRWLVNGLPNTEIIEEQAQRLVIQNFGYKKIPTRKLIQRLLYLIANMMDCLLENRIGDLKYNFDQLKKFYFILVTHIRTYLRTGLYVSEDTDFTPLEAMDYRMFCEKIEEIGKILREIRINENTKEFFLEINKYFDDVMNAYLKKDLILAHKTWFGKDNLVERANSLLSNLDCEDKDKIKNMIRIAENCKDMTAFI